MFRKTTSATACLLLCIFSFFNALAQPSNDACGSPTALTISVPAAATVWNATSSGVSTVCMGNPDDDVWFTFTGTAGGVATITLSSIGAELSASGAMIQAFSGTCGSLTSLGCANGALSPLYLSGLAATTYYIRVFSYSTGPISVSASGSNFTITVTNTALAPTNNECSGALLLPTSTGTLNSNGWLIGATTSPTTPPAAACAGTVKYDVWYKFVASKPNPTVSLTFTAPSGNSLTASGGNARLQVLTGTCGAMVNNACGTTSVTASGLTVGDTCFVRVYSVTASATPFTTNATFTIAITDPGSPSMIDSTTALFNIDTVAKNLGFPWEITYGPDDSLWITESRGYKVSRISASRTGSQQNVAAQEVLRIPLFAGEINFGRTSAQWPQGGMQGMAFHPDFMTDINKRWVYLSYVYKIGACGSPCYFNTKIVRCRFYFSADPGNPSLRLPKADTLTIMDTIISNLSGSNDHNSGRMVMSPTKEGPDNTYKIYYTIGDMGAGQFTNIARPNQAQNIDTAEGKVLRLNTEPDGDGVPGSPVHDYDRWRQWIPNNNPFNHSVFTSVKTPIFSYGHRNPQGLAWGNVGGVWRLYSSEHGDMTGDEVNIIQQGKNYGWPKITGIVEDDYTTYDDLTNGFTFNNTLVNQTVNDETTSFNHMSNLVAPIFEFFPWTPTQLQSTEGLVPQKIFKWPTVAPSGIDFYQGNIPGWKYSLLVTSLKYGMFRLKLNAAGDQIDSTASAANKTDTFPLLHSWRVRDVAISPFANSGKFWVVTDSSGSTSGPTGGFTGGSVTTKSPGMVLLLTYKTTITLPVTFESFTGRLLTDKTIRLDWKAEVDNNHRYFEVEKSIDGNNFVSIGSVDGGPPYFLIDHNPNIGNNFYRIKDVSYNEHPAYTKVINVKYDPSATIIVMYPNPMSDQLTIKFETPRSGKIQVQATDMNGRVVYKENRMVNSGAGEIKIDVRKWVPQMYSISVKGKDNEVLITQKIMKL